MSEEPIAKVMSRLDEGMNYSGCPDDWLECNDARDLAKYFLGGRKKLLERIADEVRVNGDDTVTLSVDMMYALTSFLEGEFDVEVRGES